VEFGEFSELSVQLLDDNLCVDEIFIGQLAEGFSEGSILDQLLLIIFHSHNKDLSLEFTFSLTLHAVGRIDQDAIVLVGADHGVDCVFGVVVDCVFVVGVGFGDGSYVGYIAFSHVLEGERVEVGGVVVHFGGKFVAEADQFEDLAAVDAALEGAFTEHQPDELVGFIVVLVGGAGAADEAEGGVGGENDGGVVDGPKVGQLDAFEVVIGLQIEGVASEVGLPFGRHLVEALSGQVGLLTVFIAG
jgi:hypothetical protein